MPIVSFANLISFCISFVLAVILFRVSRREPGVYFRYFFICFVLLSAFFLCIAFPGIFSSDPFVLAVLNALSLPFVLGAATSFTVIPLIALHKRKLLRTYLVFMGFAFMAAVVLRFAGFAPLQELREGDYAYWIREETFVGTVSFAIAGLAITGSMFFSAFFFFVYALRNRQKRDLLVRALLIGGGVALLGIASIINFLIGIQPTLATLSMAALTADIALLLVGAGVLYRRKAIEQGEEGYKQDAERGDRVPPEAKI